MKKVAWLLFIAPAIARSQTPFPGLIGGLATMRDRNFFASPVINPLAPLPGNPLPPRDASLPPPESNDPSFQILRSGATTRSGNTVKMTGGAEFIARGYHVFADEADGNLATTIFNLSGHVKVIGHGAIINGERITADLTNRSYRAYDANSQLSPSLIKGQIRGDLYTKGAESFGNQGETRTYAGSVTTCDKPDPHFELESDDTVVRPGRRAIFRKAHLRVFGHTILSLPFLSVPLDDRTYNNLPQVGQSQDEGYYVKNRFGVPIKGNTFLNTRLDYMTKLGTGYGGDYGYESPVVAGLTKVYLISGSTNSLVVNNQHQQKFSFGSLSLDNSYTKDDYLTSPDATNINSRLQLVMPQHTGATSTFSLNRTSNDGGSNKSEYRTISLNDSRNFGRDTRSLVDLSWVTSSNEYTGSPSSNSQEMNVRFQGSQELRKATANLEYQRNIPIGDNPNFYSGADRTTVFTLNTDAQRLISSKFAAVLPFRSSLSLGEFLDPRSQGHLTRTNFDLDVQRPDRTENRFRVDYNAQFNQGIYSDDTAQYVLGFGTAASYRLGRAMAANLRYNYLRPEGYAPLSIDYAGQSHSASTDITFKPQKYVLVGAQTGFDFLQAKQQQTGWQQISLRSEFVPTGYFSLRALSSYDTISEVWSGVKLDLNYRAGATTLSIGARYDGYRKAWSNANLYLGNLKIGRTSLSSILSYNGFTKEFDAQQYNFVYDLHCAEAVLSVAEYSTGFRPGKEVQFFLRLKALPFDSLFGLGRRGQPLSTGSGTGF